jgi:hypothetical protein
MGRGTLDRTLRRDTTSTQTTCSRRGMHLDFAIFHFGNLILEYIL